MRHLNLPVLFFVFLGLFGCKDNTSLVEAPLCVVGTTRECFNNQTREEIEYHRRVDQKTAGKGICHWGTQTCTGDDWTTCTGQGVPGPEYCNYIDDDCDGFTDDNFVDVDGKNRWLESALRKKHKPSEFTFEQLIKQEVPVDG